MLLFSCVVGLIFIIAHFIPIRPVVTIINNTGELLYIYAGESIYGVEPDPEEVTEIVKSRPEILAPGKKSH